jgi:hypothetical protein
VHRRRRFGKRRGRAVAWSDAKENLRHAYADSAQEKTTSGQEIPGTNGNSKADILANTSR